MKVAGFEEGEKSTVVRVFQDDPKREIEMRNRLSGDFFEILE